MKTVQTEKERNDARIERNKAERFFRRHFPDIKHSASRCYVFSIPKVEEITGAKCGEWIIASYDCLGNISFDEYRTVRSGLKLLAARGLIELKPGTGWGIEKTTHVRRKTIDEIKLLARRCEGEKHRIKYKKQREVKFPNNIQNGFSTPRLADRFKDMVCRG